MTDTENFSNSPYQALGSGTFMLALDGGDHDAQRAFASASLDHLNAKTVCALSSVAFMAAAALPLKRRQFDLAELAEQAAVRFVGFLFGFAQADHPLIEEAARAAAYLGLRLPDSGPPLRHPARHPARCDPGNGRVAAKDRRSDRPLSRKNRVRAGRRSRRPPLALGYAGLADCCIMLRNDWGIDPDVNLEKTKTMVARALELDPGLAEAHATRGMVLLNECHLQQSEEEFRKAIELKPSYATAHQWYMHVLCPQLRWDEALEQIEKALELDPLSPIINGNYGTYYFWKREYSKAIVPYSRALELGMKSAHRGPGKHLRENADADDAKREADVFVELLRDAFPLVRMLADTYVAYYEDDKQTVGRLLPELEAHYQEPGMANAYAIALLHFYLGDKDRGFEWLERSYARNEAPISIKLEPDLDGARTDTRYLAILKKLGMD